MGLASILNTIVNIFKEMHRNMQAVLYSKGTALRYTCNIKPFTAAHDVTSGPFDH